MIDKIVVFMWLFLAGMNIGDGIVRGFDWNGLIIIMLAINCTIYACYEIKYKARIKMLENGS